MINSVLNSGLQGALRAMERMDLAANETARFGNEGNSDISRLTGNLIEVKTQEQAIQANFSILRTADSVTGTLLDVRA